MPKAARGIIAIIFSIECHVLALMVLVRFAGDWSAPIELAGPPQPIIPVLLMPRVPPPAPASPEAPAPTTVQLHRRPPRAPDPGAVVVEPMATKALEAPPPPPPAAPVAEPAGPVLLPKSAVPAFAAMRHGRLGCANPDAYNLTRAERERCDDALAAGLRDTPLSPLGLRGDKQGEFDRAAAADEAKRRYREGGMPAAQDGGTSVAEPWRVKP